MGRIAQPKGTKGSLKWIQHVINNCPHVLNAPMNRFTDGKERPIGIGGVHKIIKCPFNMKELRKKKATFITSLHMRIGGLNGKEPDIPVGTGGFKSGGKQGVARRRTTIRSPA